MCKLCDLWHALLPPFLPGTGGTAALELGEDEELAMGDVELNTSCPVSGLGVRDVPCSGACQQRGMQNHAVECLLRGCAVAYHVRPRLKGPSCYVLQLLEILDPVEDRVGYVYERSALLHIMGAAGCVTCPVAGGWHALTRRPSWCRRLAPTCPWLQGRSCFG